MGSERFPVEVRAVGLLKHRKEKVSQAVMGSAFCVCMFRNGGR